MRAGVNVSSPELFIDHVPLLTVNVFCTPANNKFRSTELESIALSTSESLVKIFNEIGVSSFVEAVLFMATGASFTAITVIVIVAAFESAKLSSNTL